MKARPVRLVIGKGYVECSPDEVTHLELNVPGPTRRLYLPVITKGTRNGTNCWTWNGDQDQPTLRPSVLTCGTVPMLDVPVDFDWRSHVPTAFRCHSWITDGHIMFLEDTSHELRSKTIPLLDVPDRTGDYEDHDDKDHDREDAPTRTSGS